MQVASGRCFHCGESIPSGLDITLTIQDEQQAFCCYGCSAVAQMITEQGMEGFYEHRSQPSVTPLEVEPSTESELKLYDNPEIQKAFVSLAPCADGETAESEATFIIEGITCAACIWLLEKHISSQEGVASFTINHTTQRAMLRWRSHDTLLSTILFAIYQLGYKAHPYQADKQEGILAKEKKQSILRLGIAGFAMMQNMMFAIPLYVGVVSGISDDFLTLFRWVSLFVTTPVVLFSARPFFRAASRDLKSRHLTMDVPVSLAIGIAYLSSVYITIFGGEDVYFDSVAMFTFFLLLGRFLETQARVKSGLSISALINLIPPAATKLVNDEEVVLPAKDLLVGDIILVKPTAPIPADGIIVHGSSSVDESALTGEFMPITKTVGDTVIGGTTNVVNPLRISVTAVGAAAKISAVMRLLDRAQHEKPPASLLADKVASYFVASVLIITASVFGFWWFVDPQHAFPIALSVLVVTCPCALSLATPTALTTATSALRAHGFLVTRGHVLEALALTDEVVFDKTGTLTYGKLVISEVKPTSSFNEAALLSLAAALEEHSEHPIAKGFNQYYEYSADSVTATTGGGIEGVINGETYRLGHFEFASQHFAEQKKEALMQPDQGHWILLCSSEQPLGWFLIEDAIRTESKNVVATLTKNNYKISLLSGDQSNTVFDTANQLGIKNAIGSASPEDKLNYIQTEQLNGKKLMMVGDGLNDAPVMAGSQLSVAMGNANDLTKLKADAVLLSNNLATLLIALKVGKKTRSIIRQNLFWALSYNLTALPLAAMGLIPPYAAAIGMSASSLIVVCNAIRLNKVPKFA